MKLGNAGKGGMESGKGMHRCKRIENLELRIEGSSALVHRGTVVLRFHFSPVTFHSLQGSVAGPAGSVVKVRENNKDLGKKGEGR